MWDDTHFSQTWAKTVEEVSLSGKRWLVHSPNYGEAFVPERKYVVLPLDLRIINSPNQYLMTFATEISFIKDGRSCDLLDVTGQVSNPPPKFAILSSLNSTTLGPGEVKNIEIEVHSFTNIYSTVRLSTDTRSTPFIEASFYPPEVDVKGFGWATTQLTLKGKPMAALNPASIRQSLLIDANMTFPNNTPKSLTSGSDRFFSAGVAPISTSETLKFPISVFNISDYFIYLLNFLRSPINVLVGVVSLVVGLVGGGLLKKSRDKKQSEGGSIPTIAKLKESGILSESSLQEIMKDLLKKR